MGTTGVGGIPGVALICVGIDQILTGSLNRRYGRVGKNLSVIENAVFRNTGNETLAVMIPAATVFGINLLPSLAPGLFRAAGAARAGMAGAESSAGGFGLFGRVAPAPSGAISDAFRNSFINAANSPWFRFKAGVWSWATGRGAINWEQFIQKLGSAEFREFATAGQAWQSMGWSGPSTKVGQWLIGVPKWSQYVPGFGRSIVHHELFHAMQDFKYGLFGVSEATIPFMRGVRIEMAAHTFGGTGIGVGVGLVLGGAGTGIVYIVVDGVVIFRLRTGY